MQKYGKFFKIRLAALLGVLTLSGIAINANAWQRHVVVNGYALNALELSTLDQAACITVPNGYYWLLQNGVWGYQGNTEPQGYLGEKCVYNSAPSRSQGKRDAAGCQTIVSPDNRTLSFCR